MASPFKVFRKHQKWLIAVAGVGLMIVFTLGDVIPRLGGSSTPQNPIVVTCDYGDFRESDVQRMVQMRLFLKSFLNQAFQLGRAAGGTPKAFPLIPPGSPDTEAEAFRTLLLAKKAEEQGFVVSDAYLNRYLRRLVGEAVTTERMIAMIESAVIDNRALTTDKFMDALRQEMLAQRMLEIYGPAAIVTPAQDWKYFLELNDRVEAEVVPVEVKDFIGDVPDPSEGELIAFYHEYKEKYKLPDIEGGVRMESPTPGFKQPERLAFEYFEADYLSFVDLVASEVTEQEIAEYYESNKLREFEKLELLDDSDTNEPESKPADEKTSVTDPKAPATQNKKTGVESGQPPEPPAGADNPDNADSIDAGSKDNAKQPAVKKPAAANPPAGKAPPANKPAQDKQSRFSRLPMRFVALQDENAAAEPAQPQPTVESKKQPQPTGGAPAGKQKTPLDVVEFTAPIPGPPEPPVEEAAKPGKQYYTLSEVSDDIRKKLAEQRAAERIIKVLAPLSDELSAYSRALLRWQRSGEDGGEGPQSKKPARPDFAALAKENHLILGETQLVSFLELGELPLGKSTVDTGDRFNNYAFTTKILRYKPIETQSDDGNRFVAWKVDEQAERVPPLDEIRGEVVQTWKMIKARGKARERAESLAEAARKAGTALSKAFADRPNVKVTKTEPFSWRTFGETPDHRQFGFGPQVRLSEIEGVHGADNAFMKSVFTLSDGDITVAMNHPETTVYVVQVTNHLSTEDALREKFLGPPGAWQRLAQSENQRDMTSVLFESLKKDANFVEQRKLDRPREE